MIEFEKKLMLTKDEYHYLMENLGCEIPLIKKPTAKQINYYFDTDDLCMNRQNITCRIRLKDGKYKGTMKRHSLNSDHSTETEVEVYKGLYSNAFTDMGLKLQGELVTERWVIFKDANCEVVLDKNDYLGHTDYELEIEYTAEHEKDAQVIMRIFRDMLLRRKYFLAYKESLTEAPNVPSKSTRFFEKKVLIEQLCHKGETYIDEKSKVAPNKSMQRQNSASSYDDVDIFDYSDPDDYMSDYYGCIMPG